MKKLLVMVAGISVLALAQVPAHAQIALYSIAPQFQDNLLRRIDPATGATISTVPITLQGRTVLGENGLAAHPQTGQLFALLQLGGQLGRQLVTIDPVSGVATSIGNTTDRFAGLAFRSDGTLLGVTGDGAGGPLEPETLYILDTATAAPTLFQTLGNGDDGEAIAFDPADGFLYHASGLTDEVFEKVNLSTHAVTNIPRSGFDAGEITALAYSQGSFLAADLDSDFLMITPDGVISALGFLDHTSKGLARVASSPATTLVASVLPSSRSVALGDPATAFVTIINAGAVPASRVGIALATSIPATLSYQTTDPNTNALTGSPDTPVDIGPGKTQTYVIVLSPDDVFDPTEVAFYFAGTNTDPATTLVGINTLLISSSLTPVPDIVALAASGDPGIVDIPGPTGTGAFAVATVNVRASARITASADTGSGSPPVSVVLCQTNPGTGQCITAVQPSVVTQINGGETPTFGVFVTGTGSVPFDPATNRIFVRFKDASGVTRGATSVAVRTQ